MPATQNTETLMGKKDVTIYACDGCKATSTLAPGQAPRGFSNITMPGDRDYWLCTTCYGAVEWVVRFQRITHPPRVHKHGGRYGLRKVES